MKGKKGFTLVEMLVVVALLALMGITIGISLNRNIKQQNKNSYQDYVKKVKSAANYYSANNKDILNRLYNDKGFVMITTDELIDAGLINDNMVNPDTNEVITGNELIKVTLDSNGTIEVIYPAGNANNPYLQTMDIVVEYGDTSITDYCYYKINQAELGYINSEGNLVPGYLVKDSTIKCDQSSVVPTKIGTYELKYEYKLEDGTWAQKTRKVIIAAKVTATTTKIATTTTTTKIATTTTTKKITTTTTTKPVSLVSNLQIGDVINSKIKTVAAGKSVSETTFEYDEIVEHIRWSNTLPSGFTPTEKNTISVSGSAPTYIYYDSGSKTVYMYSEAQTIYLNPDANSMFAGFKNLISVDLSKFNTSKTTNMYAMFASCKSLASLDLSKFDTSNVTNMKNMFNGYNSLTSLDLSSFNTSNVTNMENMFYFCTLLKTIKFSSAFNTKNVTNMHNMFMGCNSLTSLDLSSFNTSSVTTMEDMFNGCSSLTSLDLRSFNTSNVTTMYGMFSGCKKVNNIKFSSSFNTSNVTSMIAMFETCSSLTSLDLSSFNTSKVTNMLSMFRYCSSLTSLNLSSFNTSNVENMSQMFEGCSSLTSLNISSFNTSKVTSMQMMFSECSSLISLDISSFNTSKVTTFYHMFYNCRKLRTIYASTGFDAANKANRGMGMFAGCDSLVGGRGTKYNNGGEFSMTGEWMAVIDNPPSDYGYLTRK